MSMCEKKLGNIEVRLVNSYLSFADTKTGLKFEIEEKVDLSGSTIGFKISNNCIGAFDIENLEAVNKIVNYLNTAKAMLENRISMKTVYDYLK